MEQRGVPSYARTLLLTPLCFIVFIVGVMGNAYAFGCDTCDNCLSESGSCQTYITDGNVCCQDFPNGEWCGSVNSGPCPQGNDAIGTDPDDGTDPNDYGNGDTSCPTDSPTECCADKSKCCSGAHGLSWLFTKVVGWNSIL